MQPTSPGREAGLVDERCDGPPTISLPPKGTLPRGVYPKDRAHCGHRADRHFDRACLRRRIRYFGIAYVGGNTEVWNGSEIMFTLENVSHYIGYVQQGSFTTAVLVVFWGFFTCVAINIRRFAKKPNTAECPPSKYHEHASVQTPPEREHSSAYSMPKIIRCKRATRRARSHTSMNSWRNMGSLLRYCMHRHELKAVVNEACSLYAGLITKINPLVLECSELIVSPPSPARVPTSSGGIRFPTFRHRCHQGCRPWVPSLHTGIQQRSVHRRWLEAGAVARPMAPSPGRQNMLKQDAASPFIQDSLVPRA